MKLFARPTDITPFLLLANIAGRSWGGYVIDGGIGLIHRPFERHWSATAGTGDDELTAFLHSANFGALNEFAFIDPDSPIEMQIYPWCEAALALINTLPATQAELRTAYQEKRLAGKPLDAFLLGQPADRKAAFHQFIAHAC